ncbi:MAG: type VI secretion system membrane subunit TssM [Gemmobacter sp.]
MIRRYIWPLLRTTFGLMVFIAIALSVLMWYFGNLVAWGDWRPFDTLESRITAIAVIFGLTLFVYALIRFFRWRRNRRLARDIVDTVEDDPEPDALQSEADEMKAKLRTALTQLRKSKMGARSLYELPWYIMIGPPGAGKTTAIINSGLKFPLVEEFGSASIGGVGGTRNCDWWFTDNAVMIDTAGRYTTQESDAEADNKGWLGFLALLKKHRKRQPINGAIIAISLSDLSLTDEVTQAGHARSIRKRLHELREKLGVRFPVYVMFTKADLIAGFAEFFDNLGKEAREQVWGFTLPLEKPKANVSPIAAFDDEFSALLTQLNAQSLERMQQETDHQRRSLIAGFPGQVASVRQVARDFLTEVFLDNKFEQRHLLRGVYFASGTQEGTPIDRLMMGMARTFGIGRQAIGTGKGTGRSYFLTRLFDQVIFKEAGLVSADDKVERRYRWTRRAAIAASVLIAGGAGTLWVRSYLGNQAMMAQASEGLAAYQAAAAQIPSNPIGDSDIVSTLPALNILRALPANPLAGEVPDPGSLGWGLYQGDSMGSSAAQAYRAGLNQHLLPRLLLRLENQMQSTMNQPELLYEALKVYLMLGQQGPLNADLVREWMALDWAVSFPGPANDQVRAELTLHLEAMLSQPMQSVALNGPLVEQAQTILTELPMAQRIYNGIVNSPKALALPQWRVTEVGGPAVSRVFVRSSGKPLNDGIEGIFTYAGFNEVFLGEALEVVTRLQNESWVLGPNSIADQSQVALLAMSRDVLDLYYNDFIARYEAILGDIDIIPLESASHAADVTNILSGPTSPIANLLTAISEESRLTENRSVVPDGVAEGAQAVARLELRSALSLQAQAFLNEMQAAAEGDGETAKVPGQVVEERFAWLHELVDRPENQPSQLDDLLVVLTDVYRELAKIGFAGGVTGAPQDPEESPLFQLSLMTRSLPEAIQRWAAQISAGAAGITADGTRSSINATWQSQIQPICAQSLEGRYPFNRRAKEEMGIADFTKMFAPGGLLDAFFNEHLAKNVDTSTKPWSFKKLNDVDLGISPAVLEQFMYAAEIRSAFFPTGPAPQVQFSVTPQALDDRADSVTLDIDGSVVKLSKSDGQPAPTGVIWPGAAGFGRITFDPPDPAVENSIRRDGPWGWFRLLDSASMKNTDVTAKKRVIFNVGGRLAIFEVQTSSAINPFALAALTKFSCPKSF